MLKLVRLTTIKRFTPFFPALALGVFGIAVLGYGVYLAAEFSSAREKNIRGNEEVQRISRLLEKAPIESENFERVELETLGEFEKLSFSFGSSHTEQLMQAFSDAAERSSLSVASINLKPADHVDHVPLHVVEFKTVEVMLAARGTFDHVSDFLSHILVTLPGSRLERLRASSPTTHSSWTIQLVLHLDPRPTIDQPGSDNERLE